MTEKTNTLTQARLQELLHYDPETGLFRWLISQGRAVAGSIAGTKCPRGYITIKLDKRLHKAHRLAVLYMTGEWPPAHIDHRDDDKSNNRWKNLRPATHGQNCLNRKAQRNSVSGFKGVSALQSGKFAARIVVDGKLRHIGLFDNARDAALAYDEKARIHHGEFFRPNIAERSA